MPLNKINVYFHSSFGKLSKTLEEGVTVFLDSSENAGNIMGKIGVKEGEYGFLTRNGVVLSPDKKIESNDNIIVFPMIGNDKT